MTVFANIQDYSTCNRWHSNIISFKMPTVRIITPTKKLQQILDMLSGDDSGMVDKRFLIETKKRGIKLIRRIINNLLLCRR